MADRVHVVPAQLRDAAAEHAATSEHLRAMPSSHGEIQESLDSLGPIFGELRDAATELLEQRRRCYEQQADDHQLMADNLRRSAELWEEQDARAAQQLGSVHDESR
ncbi:ESX-1 secretion-associated protein [Mycolicibacterium palauense]|uniref:ESX-1 secretion-associated protein n=1 Tax=Mycolicibacterium palauense TaxID=2034511 RepID=UPI000BFED493|nr:ESX-1 secretion-associated protein [Mycolicibacterium palauense]